MSYIFQAFKAISDANKCLEFHSGHTRILEDLGITNLTSNVPNWIDDPDVLVISAYEESTMELIGGIRVHKYNKTHTLPIIEAVKEQDPKIISIFDNFLELGVVESCGLWNSKKVYGKGISPLLARCSVALSATLNPGFVTCFSAPYTLRMISRLGFTPIHEIGDNGQFPYPTDKFISSALIIRDLYMLGNAVESERDRIFSLMSNPHQNFLENSQGKELLVQYNLLESIDVEGRRNESQK